MKVYHAKKESSDSLAGIFCQLTQNNRITCNVKIKAACKALNN
jgi:hypothetical protein